MNKSQITINSEYQREKADAQAEIDKYGRQWIWENYISEDRKEKWMEISEQLRHINPHVLEDIEDFIIIQGFKPRTDKDRKELETILNAMKVEKHNARKK